MDTAANSYYSNENWLSILQDLAQYINIQYITLNLLTRSESLNWSKSRYVFILYTNPI